MHTIEFGDVYGYFLTFLRVGAALAFMPAIGEMIITTRIKILIALILSFVTYQVVGDSLPEFPDNPSITALLLIKEAFIGLFIGLIGRIILSLLDIAGSIMSFQMGLSNATIFNPAIKIHGSLVGSAIAVAATVLIFATDMHHMIIHTIIDSYKVLPVGSYIILGDFSSSMAQLVQRTFVLAIDVSIPFLIIGTVFQVSLGLFNRLMPQIQVFFVGMPLQTLGGILLFFLTVSAILLRWAISFRDLFPQTIGLD